MRPHPKRARTDPSSPRAWATSDRSGMVGNHEDMQWQFQWSGTQLINEGILVYPFELDEPQEQLRSIILPPDPPPIPDARPEPYTIDEQQPRFQMDEQVRLQEDEDKRLQSNLQSGEEQ